MPYKTGYTRCYQPSFDMVGGRQSQMICLSPAGKIVYSEADDQERRSQSHSKFSTTLETLLAITYQPPVGLTIEK
jgi:hypothetical protein